MERGVKAVNGGSYNPEAASALPTRDCQKAVALAVWCWGVVCALGLLKFGNPVIMERLVSWPSDAFEWVLSPWPLTLGYGFIALAIGLSLRAMPGRRGWNPQWLAAVPALWLSWQCLSAMDTVDRALTKWTLPHFIVCGTCFFVGFKLLALRNTLRGFWAICTAALLWVLAYGIDQRFRGLPETQAFLLQHEATHWQNFPAEERSRWERSGLLIRTAEGWTAHPMLLEKARSLRISSTLFYPNTLAGALLLFGPPVLWALATTPLLTTGAKALMGFLIGGGAVACLYWSGSRSGWLVALGLALVTFLVWPWPRTTKLAVLAGLTALGLGVFVLRHATFFQRGAPSVVARLDYWQAAWQTAWEHPWFGTGPGTFQRPYEQRKRPESEMARLAHNDYLQQASDSGWPGALLYAGWVWGGLIWTGRRLWGQPMQEGFFVWLGLLGWAVQSCVEFHLYIPALAWPAFLWLGWLAARVGENDSTTPAPSA